MTLAGRQKGHRRPEVAAAEDTNFLWLLFRVVVDVLLEGGARPGLRRHGLFVFAASMASGRRGLVLCSGRASMATEC
jgi:hypothetical protein